MSLDFHRAFESVSQQNFDELLRFMGIPIWVWRMFTSCIQGGLVFCIGQKWCGGQEFLSTQDIRQADPLSSILLVLVTSVLVVQLRQVENV